MCRHSTSMHTSLIKERGRDRTDWTARRLMTRCSCGAFLEELVHTRLIQAAKTRRTPHAPPQHKQKTQTRQREQTTKITRTENSHATKRKTRRPTNKQTKQKQKQRQTRDREGDPAQPLLHLAKPGVLQQKETVTNTKNITQQKKQTNDTDSRKRLERPITKKNKKPSKTPAGVRFGNHQTQRAEKESPPPPSCLVAILPILARSREGRATDKRGVGGISFLSPGTR